MTRRLVDVDALTVVSASHVADGRTLHADTDCPRDTTCPVYATLQPRFEADENHFTAAMAVGHRGRTGHRLTGHWVTSPDTYGVRRLFRTCCGEGR